MPLLSTAIMMSGELSMRRWKYFLSSDNMVVSCFLVYSIEPELFRGAEPEFRDRHIFVKFFESNLYRHPAPYVVRLDAKQVRDELASLFELDDYDRVRHLVGAAGVIELMHYIEAEDLAATADRDPARGRRVAFGAEVVGGES